jgi:hypothetical protein
MSLYQRIHIPLFSVANVGNPDKEPIELFADASKISRRQVFDDQSYLLYVVAYSARKWGAIKRKAKALGWELTQDGDDEGCLRLGLPDGTQSDYLRALLGLRRRRQATARMSAIGGKADIARTWTDIEPQNML